MLLSKWTHGKNKQNEQQMHCHTHSKHAYIFDRRHSSYRYKPSGVNFWKQYARIITVSNVNKAFVGVFVVSRSRKANDKEKFCEQTIFDGMRTCVSYAYMRPTYTVHTVSAHIYHVNAGWKEIFRLNFPCAWVRALNTNWLICHLFGKQL